MKRIFFPAVPVLLVLAGCSGMPELPSLSSALTPYHIDVRQGNFVTQEMMAQLKVGQTKDQVRFILGTPLVADMFHGDRWDYIYRFQPGKGEVQQRRVAIYFANGKLARIVGDVVASERVAVPPVPIAPDSPSVAPGAPPAATSNAGQEAMKLESSMTPPTVK